MPAGGKSEAHRVGLEQGMGGISTVGAALSKIKLVYLYRVKIQ